MLLLGACGGGGDTSSQGSSPKPSVKEPDPGREAGGECEHSSGALSVSAKEIKFDKKCLAAPADQAFSIEFNNAEAVPHNVAILASHDSPDPLFRGEVFSGPGARTYQVNALKAGHYHFHCDVHPEMQGDFVVA